MIGLDMKSFQEKVMSGTTQTELAHLNVAGLPAGFGHSFFEPTKKKCAISNATNMKAEVIVSNSTIISSK